MAPSQLKRLKSSLREQGITGPQKSKKQIKAIRTGRDGGNDRNKRNTALQQIRDSFNPFEIKTPSRPQKFQHASANGGTSKTSYKDVLHRPGVTKSAGEEMRRAQLLPELRRRNKVGGLIDRRIGEGDPGMTAEERAVQRFAQEKSRKKGANLFNLEASDDDEPRISLTHGGRSLEDLPSDAFSVSEGDDYSNVAEDLHRRKRRKSMSEDENEEDANMLENHLDKKKSKKEVMEEVIAKSKLHKYERQKAKEDDDDLREELDSGMQDVLTLLQQHKKPLKEMPPTDFPSTGSEPSINPDRQRLLDGWDRAKADKEYDARLKQLAQDTRAKPSERTKTSEEKAAAEAQRLKDMEERRLKRMRGEDVSDDEKETKVPQADGNLDGDDEFPDEAARFGFTSLIAQSKAEEEKQRKFEDEDEFDLDEDLIASGSDIDVSDASSITSISDHVDMPSSQEEDDDFISGILGKKLPSTTGDSTMDPAAEVAYTYPCPKSHSELLDIIGNSPVEQLPITIQRIRALYHPSLSDSNNEALGQFSSTLVDHLSYMGLEKQPLPVAEQVIRHLHSLSRSHPEKIAHAFRRQLELMHEQKDLNAGHFLVLTAIGSIYPTSDHFHQIVTPAMTLMCRWLGLNKPATARQSVIGSFLVTLCIHYQRLSRRYIPEAINFTLTALSPKKIPGLDQIKQHLENLVAMANLWKDKSAFQEIFAPAIPVLKRLSAKREQQTLTILLTASRHRRRPLQLHHHRPLSIRTSIPKFEDNFNPDKHYDPDKERSDAKKLQKEYKRERKGALRELRKDANFVARDQLREKRERDAEYEKKYRRLVAEVQGEEGREAKEYEREKRMRKTKR